MNNFHYFAAGLTFEPRRYVKVYLTSNHPKTSQMRSKVEHRFGIQQLKTIFPLILKICDPDPESKRVAPEVFFGWMVVRMPICLKVFWSSNDSTRRSACVNSVTFVFYPYLFSSQWRLGC